MEMETNRLGVRKGAWTKDEDNLLRKCVNNFGEGKWHLVPLRAGLNRCRKSCRLRWLNYLRPNLKKGSFSKDEVDLILRLHKLLGNRWSLIAGRLPGRTANDIKNFWNTHFDKKSSVEKSFQRKTTQNTMITKSNIIRPRPQTFSKLQVPSNCRSQLIAKINEPNIDENLNKKPSSSESNNDKIKMKKNLSSSSQENEDDECIRWWGNLLEMTEKGEATAIWFSDEDHVITKQQFLSSELPDHANNFENYDGLSDWSLDVGVWDMLSLND